MHVCDASLFNEVNGKNAMKNIDPDHSLLFEPLIRQLQRLLLQTQAMNKQQISLQM